MFSIRSSSLNCWKRQSRRNCKSDENNGEKRPDPKPPHADRVENVDDQFREQRPRRSIEWKRQHQSSNRNKQKSKQDHHDQQRRGVAIENAIAPDQSWGDAGHSQQRTRPIDRRQATDTSANERKYAKAFQQSVFVSVGDDKAAHQEKYVHSQIAVREYAVRCDASANVKSVSYTHLTLP